MNLRNRAAALVAVAMASGAGWAQPYTAQVLHPTGAYSSVLNGVSGSTKAGAVRANSANLYNAVVWAGASDTLENVNPPAWLPYSGSYAYGVDGPLVAGYAVDLGTQLERAMIWNLNQTATDPARYINVHPAGYYVSTLYGIQGGNAVGFGIEDVTFRTRALLFSGSGYAATDLTPFGLDGVANAVSGSAVVGDCWGDSTGGRVHAFSLDSGQDIHPGGFLDSSVRGTSGTQHIGWASQSDGTSACVLWNGNNSPVSLHPAGYFASRGFAINGGVQGGDASLSLNGPVHAMLWFGTPGSAVDLHALLPAQFTDSTVLAVDGSGNAFGVATTTDQDGFPVQYAVKWMVNPYTFNGFEEPVNDPASPESVFKQNRTINLRFSLTDALGQNVAYETVELVVTQVGPSSDPITAIGTDEPTSVGGVFEYEPGSRTYSYKLATKALDAGFRYRLTARIASNGQEHSVTVSIR